jgi:FkbM family methyltransferase
MDNIYKFQAVLGKDHTTVDLNRRIMNNTGTHSVRDDFPGHIPVLKLDDFNIRDVDMIWLDVENYEYKVLQGAMQMIAQHKPVVMTERGVDVIKGLLEPLGYKVARKSVSDTVWIA